MKSMAILKVEETNNKKNEYADICEHKYALYISRQTQMIRFHVSVHCCMMAGQRAELSQDKRYREQNHAKEKFLDAIVSLDLTVCE